jgi:predicted Zn-dependent protease
MRHCFALFLAGSLLSFPLLAADDKEKNPDEIGNRDVGKGLNFYSVEKEIALGKQMAQQIERQAKIIDDPVIAEYVNRIGQNLVRNSDAKVPFTIKVIDTEDVNAFALPGGFFFVNSGLILKADTEAELAGVMAHEIAHVAARHGTRNASRAEVAQLSTIPLIFLGGWAGYGIRQAANLMISVGFLQFSQANERERRTCSACSTCTKLATILEHSSTSSKRSSLLRRKSPARYPSCLRRIFLPTSVS